MYSNNIENFQESTTILNACTKKSGNLLNTPRTFGKGKKPLSTPQVMGKKVPPLFLYKDSFGMK